MFPRRVPRTSLSLAAALLALVAAPAAASDRPPLGLMGTIPIYWGEAAGFGEVLRGESEPHWAREQLEAGYDLRPIDLLTPQALEGLDRILLAQPRVLSPAENVALDDWVRAGGRVLLFADPLMTGHSPFGIGDRRRPQDVALLSPILARWGLRLELDDAEMAGVRLVDASGASVPVNVPGHFVQIEPIGENAGSTCALAAEAILASCVIGEGRATILADAALLDLHEHEGYAPAALDALVSLAFAKPGN